MIVVDASLLLEVLLRRPAALRAEARLSGVDEIVMAPHLLDLEVGHVLRKLVLQREIDENVARRRSGIWRRFRL